MGSLDLMEEEKDTVVTDDVSAVVDSSVHLKWMVGKLITKRPFQKDSMVTMFKNVWRLSRLVEVSAMDSNLFLFKFANLRDKDRVIE